MTEEIKVTQADKAFSEELLAYVGLQDASKMRFSQEELRYFYRAAWDARHRQDAVKELVEALSNAQDSICKAYCVWSAHDDHVIEHVGDCKNLTTLIAKHGAGYDT